MQHLNIPLKRGDICFVTSNDITPTGHEIWADRYAIIVSNDTNNKHLSTVNIVYLTANQKHRLHPTQVKLNIDGVHAVALCEQIHCVDKSRLSIKKGTLSQKEMSDIDSALLFSLQLTKKNITAHFKKWEHYVKRYQNKIEAEQRYLLDIEREKIGSITSDQLEKLQLERDCFKTLYELQNTPAWYKNGHNMCPKRSSELLK